MPDMVLPRALEAASEFATLQAGAHLASKIRARQSALDAIKAGIDNIHTEFGLSWLQWTIERWFRVPTFLRRATFVAAAAWLPSHLRLLRLPTTEACRLGNSNSPCCATCFRSSPTWTTTST